MHLLPNHDVALLLKSLSKVSDQGKHVSALAFISPQTVRHDRRASISYQADPVQSKVTQ